MTTNPTPSIAQAAGEPETNYMLSYELEGVIIDTEENGFDAVCLETVKRVRDALRIAASTPSASSVPEPVGEIVAFDMVLGWHFQPYVDWEQIGAGTKLYAAPTPSASSVPVAWIEQCEMEELSEAASVRFGVTATFWPEQGDPNHNYVPLYAAPPDSPAPSVLTDADIENGWHKTFSTDNPYCPCNLKSFTKAVRWAERAKEK